MILLMLQNPRELGELGTAMGWTGGVPFLAQAREFSILHSIQTGSGAHQTSYLMGTDAITSGIKRL
jgi:hypothetical protein